jgi:hypothetical protein
MKTCYICKKVLSFDLFSKNKKSKDGLKHACKKCLYEKERETQKKYRAGIDKNKKSAYNKKHYQDHKDKKKEYDRVYYQLNKSKISKRKVTYNKKRRKEDPAFKLRKLVSDTINIALKSNNGSKNKASCLKYLPYSMQELTKYIENLFEPWMNWQNHGIYNLKNWDDNSPTTWMWNIDHIIPQSDLPYKTMEEENFKKCWALENLRPYSAKQNILDGVNRVRHTNNVNGANSI